jgi:hypothetical protein
VSDATTTTPSLLAIDLGLWTGYACFVLGERPRLRWYRSQHFGTRAALKRAIPRVLAEAAPLSVMVLEGDRHLGDLWSAVATRRGARVVRVAPETWRKTMLLPRQQRHGHDAKAAAVAVALACIQGSDAPLPKTALGDDVAEAICIGLYALQTVSPGELTAPTR